ncbi:hypothetical protein ACTXT7_016147 [Hymenolepis weldensis]
MSEVSQLSPKQFQQQPINLAHGLYTICDVGLRAPLQSRRLGFLMPIGPDPLAFYYPSCWSHVTDAVD